MTYIADDLSTPIARRTPLDPIALAEHNAALARSKREYYGGDPCGRCGSVMAAEGRHHCRPKRREVRR